jgi:hypothetical protein
MNRRLLSFLAVPFSICILALVGNCQAGAGSLQPGSLRVAAEEARAKGEQSVTVWFSGGIPDDAGGLDDALDHFNVVIASPVSSAVTIEPSFILTWYKFRIQEELSVAKKCEPCQELLETPPQLLPLARNEIAIPVTGGTAEIEGVQVTVKSRRPTNFVVGQRYLLFLRTGTAPSNVAYLGGGPSGAYQIDQNGRLISASKSALSGEVMSSETLPGLRKYIKNRALTR